MFKRLLFIYSHHFRLALALNLFVSSYFTWLMWIKGFGYYNLYMLALLFKAIGYGITVLVEKLFFESREYYFRNLGLSYRQLFSILFSADFLLFLSFIMISLQCKNFMQTA